MATVRLSEIAEVLCMNWRAASRMAKREKWIFEISDSSQGKARRYQVETLPIAIKLAIVKQLALKIDKRLEFQASDFTTLGSNDENDGGLLLKDWQWDAFDARLALLLEFKRLKAEHGTNHAIEMLLAMVKQDLLPPFLKRCVICANARRGKKRTLSRSMILGWQRAVRNYGILGLIPKPMGRRDPQSLTAHYHEILEVSPNTSIAKVMEKLATILPDGIDLPSQAQVLKMLHERSRLDRENKIHGVSIQTRSRKRKEKKILYVTLEIDLAKPILGLDRLREIIIHRTDVQENIKTSFSQAIKHITPLLTRHTPVKLASPLTEEEILRLNRYKAKSHKKDSAKAEAILMMNQNAPLIDIGIATNAGKGTIYRWKREFNATRMDSIEIKMTPSPERIQIQELRKTRIIDIIHKQPEFFDINRTSWTYGTIVEAYTQTYGGTCTKMMVKAIVKSTGCTWRRARKVWTSPDPLYREKIGKVLDALHDLKEGELFFFIDEAGPYQVKQYGGRSLVVKDEHPAVPEYQKTRGSMQLIAALEAVTNQVSWSFIRSKNTDNIVFMLEQLCALSRSAPRIFVTWDSISSHGSQKLASWKSRHNREVSETGIGPLVEIVPLPSRAQFLNVIEAVFSGMKRAVIENSNYGSKKEMEKAISRHFEERNLFYKNNPKRAGNKIWDRESFDLEKLPGGLFRRM